MCRKNDARITVQDVLDAANISRGTFYAHYRDIPDLAEHVEQSIIAPMMDALSGITLEQIIEDPRVQVERRSILAAVLSSSDRPKVIRMMKELLMQALAAEWIASTKLEKVNIVDACAAGALFDACMTWAMNDQALSKEGLINTISDFLSGGLRKFTMAKKKAEDRQGVSLDISEREECPCGRKRYWFAGESPVGNLHKYGYKEVALFMSQYFDHRRKKRLHSRILAL